MGWGACHGLDACLLAADAWDANVFGLEEACGRRLLGEERRHSYARKHDVSHTRRPSDASRTRPRGVGGLVQTRHADGMACLPACANGGLAEVLLSVLVGLGSG